MRGVVVMFPDFHGKGMLGNFGEKLQRECTDMYMIPILNGLPIERLERIQREAVPEFSPFVSVARGLLGTLVSGYRKILQDFPGCTVVRLDTEEHPVEYVERLANKAKEIAGMVIGDLEFGPNFLKENTPDEFTHLDIFPILYGQFTGGKLPISCTHGFQAFAPKVCATVFRGALKIVTEVENELGVPVEWGFDGAMALAAVKLGVPVCVEKVPAEKLRNRERKKIADQFNGALRMCRAADRVSL